MEFVQIKNSENHTHTHIYIYTHTYVSYVSTDKPKKKNNQFTILYVVEDLFPLGYAFHEASKYLL